MIFIGLDCRSDPRDDQRLTFWQRIAKTTTALRFRRPDWPQRPGWPIAHRRLGAGIRLSGPGSTKVDGEWEFRSWGELLKGSPNGHHIHST
jgi:hypothetical protein